jgi:hypothetical protein
MRLRHLLLARVPALVVKDAITKDGLHEPFKPVREHQHGHVEAVIRGIDTLILRYQT